MQCSACQERKKERDWLDSGIWFAHSLNKDIRDARYV